jgi:PKD repeat protein
MCLLSPRGGLAVKKPENHKMIHLYTHFLKFCKEKLIFLFVLLFPLFVKSQQSNCANADFSQGNFTNWTGNTSVYPYNTPGTNIGTPQAPYPSPAYYYSTGIVPGRHTIITTSTPDPLTCGNVMTVPPGEKYSVRLGNGGIGSWGNGVQWQRDYLSYNFDISSSNSMVVYKYAVVLQDPVPKHTKSLAPRFIVSVTDSQGKLMDSICDVREVYADSTLGFHICDEQIADTVFGGKVESPGNITYTDWRTVGLDLRKYTGKNIRLKFETWDCGLSGHFGYAYLTAKCAEMKINASTCIPDGPVTLTAPEGFTYKWLPAGQTTQSITLNNAKFGDSAAVELTAVSGCKSVLKTKLFQNYPTAYFTFDSACAGVPVHFKDQSVGGVSWSWDFGDGTTATIQHPDHIYSTQGIYTVRLAVTNSDACADSVVSSLYVCPRTGIHDPEQTPVFHVYPNPSTGLYKIEGGSANSGNVQVDVSDVLGRLIYSEKNVAKNGLLQKELDIKGQPDGMYFLTIKSAEYSKVVKLVKKN